MKMPIIVGCVEQRGTHHGSRFGAFRCAAHTLHPVPLYIELV
jgi:hypothetical protein